MTNPKIKVEADVTAVGSAVTQVGQTVARVNREATRVIDQLRVAGRKLTDEQIAQGKKAYDALRVSGARGARALKGQSFEEFVGGGYQRLAVSRVEAERMRRQVLQHIGLGGAGGGGGASFGSYAGGTALQAGRGVLQAAFPFGGPGGTIARHSIDAARGAGGMLSAGGMGRLAVGGGIGLAAFGAIKGVQSVVGKIGAAEDESSEYADLLRQIGATSTEFTALRESVRGASKGLGLAYNESAKLAAVYASEARLPVKDRGMLAGEVGVASGFARASGTDPGQSASFFGAMRHYGVAHGESDQRRLAGQLQEAVSATGKSGGMGELMDTMRQFVSTVGARTLVAANADGFLGMSSRLARIGVPGLTIDKAAGLASRLDQGFAGGAGGEPSDNLLLSSMRGQAGGIDALDLADIKAGGLQGAGDSVFGKGSVKYKLAAALAQQSGDNTEVRRLDAIVKAMGSKTTGQIFGGGLLKAYGNDSKSITSAASTSFGTNASESAAYILSLLDGNQGINKAASFSGPPTPSIGDEFRQATADMENVFQGFASSALPLLTAIRDGVVFFANKFGAGINAAPTAEPKSRAAAAALSAFGVPSDAAPAAGGGKTNLPPWLVDIATREGMGDARGLATVQAIYDKESSGGKNTATSGKGAKGGFQVIPDTFARMMGTYDGQDDPQKNATAGIRYLARLRKLAHGKTDLIGAGYLGGEGAIGPFGNIVNPGVTDGHTSRADYGADLQRRVDAIMSGGDPLLPPGAGRAGSQSGAAVTRNHNVAITLKDPQGNERHAPIMLGILDEPRPSGGLGSDLYVGGYR